MSNETEGWVSQPDTRGTIDIVWSCLSPIALCTWTVLCLNLPYTGEPWLRRFARKIRWWFLALMAPELLAAFAIGQWALAKKSVQDFESSKFKPWTIQHAFYANMGGFLLDAPKSTPFPVNAQQIHWLIDHGYLELPSLSVEDIGDKSKSDRLARVITCAQITWFLLQAFGRVAQGLAITTLEISTVAFVFCTFGTYFFWLYKPLDIQTPTVLTANASIADILTAAGPRAAKPHRQTPMDFIDRNGPTFSIHAAPMIGLKVGTRVRPLNRIPNDRLPVLTGQQQAILLCLNLVFSAIHFWGWNASFASDAEQKLWRICSITLVSAVVLFWLVDRPIGWYHGGRIHLQAARLASWVRRHVYSLGDIAATGEKGPLTLQKRGRRYPISEAAFMFVLGVVYALARLVLLAESFAGLRKLPNSAFQNVQWSDVLPHI